MTANPRYTSSSRPASGCPVRLTSGTASSAASVIAPRIPAQPSSVRSRQPSDPARVRNLRRARISLPNAHIQNSRTPVTVSTTTVPVSTSRPTGPLASRVNVWKDSPVSTNRKASTRNTSVCQNAPDCSRLRAENASPLLCQPRYRPQVTAASTPEACTASAGM